MTPRRREALILGAVSAGAAVAGALAGALALQSRSGAADLLSSRFPDLDGRVRRLAEWQGRPLLCNFWATWCAPCREELPLLDAARQRHASIGFEVVGIAADNASNVADYLKAVKVRYPVLIGGAGAIDLMRRLGNGPGALPFTVAVDAAGRLRSRRLGAYSGAELQAELAVLFG
jgi:thiol-disulfide isomerase/thioredoxin